MSVNAFFISSVNYITMEDTTASANLGGAINPDTKLHHPTVRGDVADGRLPA